MEKLSTARDKNDHCGLNKKVGKEREYSWKNTIGLKCCSFGWRLTVNGLRRSLGILERGSQLELNNASRTFKHMQATSLNCLDHFQLPFQLGFIDTALDEVLSFVRGEHRGDSCLPCYDPSWCTDE